MSQKVSVDERRRLVAQSLQVGNPGNNARDLASAADARSAPDQREHQIELAVDDIRPYENNPRHAINAKFDDIKESIRTSGLKSPLTVTRRPGESHYIVESGGNTRLLALQQLWAETRDVRYRQLVVLFRPWRSESHVLSAHLIENDLRGDMSFWDKATGVMALREQLEAEQGRQLGLRPLEDLLHALGLAVNPATLAHYLFATRRLRTLGEAVPGLAGLHVRGLQPRLNALKRIAQERKALSEDALYELVFEPVFRRIADKYAHSEEFSVAATCDACEEALAAFLGEPVQALRDELRPGSAKEQSEGVPPGGTDAAHSPAGGAPTPVVLPLQIEAGSDGLLHRARAFATAAGLGDCIAPEPASRSGFRVAARLEPDHSTPARHRAWCLLAGISGQVEPEDLPPLTLDPEFIFWLADPADSAATAFWDVLTCLRDTRGQGVTRDGVGSDDAPTAGEGA